MITGQAASSPSAPAAPFRAGRLRARRPRDQRAFITIGGFLAAQVATPRVMLTPDRTGIEVTILIHEGPASGSAQLRVYERDADGTRDRAARRAPRAPRDGAGQAGRLVQPRRAGEGSRRDPDASTGTPATPTSRRRLTPSSTRTGARSTSPSASAANRARLLRRIEIRGNTKTRDKVIRREMEVEERRAVQRDEAGAIEAADHGARLLRAGRHLHRAGRRPAARSTSTSTSARSRRAPSRSARASRASRTSSRRRRSSRRTCSSGQSPSLQAQISGLAAASSTSASSSRDLFDSHVLAAASV